MEGWEPGHCRFYLCFSNLAPASTLRLLRAQYHSAQTRSRAELALVWFGSARKKGLLLSSLRAGLKSMWPDPNAADAVRR